MLRQRNRNRQPGSPDRHVAIVAVHEGKPKDDSLLLNGKAGPFAHSEKTAPDRMSQILRKQPVWLLLAIASGSCAAFNGVFAKLTTTALTTAWSHAVAQVLSLSPDNKIVEYLIRAIFFGLNLVFNLAMWTLFTAALMHASSTTHVSIINTSANFFVTAMLGLIIFGEQLPPMWWAGAGLLAAGNVIIGRREEDKKPDGPVGRERDDEEEQTLLGEDIGAGDAMGLGEELGGAETTKEALQKGEEVDAPIR